MRLPLAAILLAVLMTGAACSGKKGMHDLRSNSPGPDEFMVLPVEPLTAPKDYAVLPAPTPGGANLTDPHPQADAVAALGGNPAALNATGVPSSDGALVARASRYGVPQNIRTTVDTEDAKFRKQQKRLSSFRLFPVDRYQQAYRRQKINPFEQTDLFRSYGIATPSSPPVRE